MLHALRDKVEEVYRSCVGDSGANLSTLQMLTSIENRLGELMERMETIPKERLQMAEKAKEKERRIRWSTNQVACLLATLPRPEGYTGCATETECL